MRALFDNANDLIVGAAPDGRLLYVNNAWRDTLDFSTQDVATASLFEFIHHDTRAAFIEGFRRAAAGVKIRNMEATFLSKFSKRVVVEGSLHCEVVKDEVVAIQCIFRDITEKKRAASALKQSEDRFARVFAASPIAIGIAALSDGRFQDVNDSFLGMLGYERHEVVGVTDQALGLWAAEDDRARILRKLENGHTVRDFHGRLRAKQGEVREALISAELIDVNHEARLLLMLHDTTERANLEAQLRQVQKMEGIGQLAAGVAHDFNNILTVIQGHAGRLRPRLARDLEADASVEQISFAADRAANLTRQLLTFCRKQAMLPEVLDLNAVVHRVAKMLERSLGTDIHIELQVEPGLPLVEADPGMMELSLINMASNARDAMPRGGRLIISTARIEVPEHYLEAQPKARLGSHVLLSIEDTGCGMDEETLRRAFEPFFTTKEVGEGTGLGLATVYGIIEQHQGWIEVASKVGQGTKFEVFLPVTTKAGKRVAPQLEPAAPSATRPTILLVEDEAMLRELARAVLEHGNYRVLEAASGVQALKVWAEHKGSIDMLLTDMVMPEGISGRDLAERIQQDRPDIKVLYSSGYSPDVVGGHFNLPENSFFLPKPYHPPRLIEAVRECLEHAPAPASLAKN